MKKINRSQLINIKCLHHSRCCIKCGEKSDLFLIYNTWFHYGYVPLCEKCYREFLKGEINI